VLQKQFGGAAAGAADTFQGQLARLKIGFDKLIEAVGEIVLPILERFVAMLNKHIVPALRIFVDQLRGGNGVAGSFEVAIASMGDFAPVAIRAMRAATEAVLEFVKTIALAYAGIQTLIGAAQALATRGKAGLPAFGAALAAAGGAVITDQLKARTLGYFDDLESRLGSLSTKANAARSALNPIPDRLDRISAAANALAGGTEEEEGGGGGGGSGLNKMAERAKKLQERLEAAAKALRDDMANALQIAEERLQQAQQAFDEFADSVTSTIKDSLDFGDALEASAEEGGKSFFDELANQANRAEEFGRLTEELLRRDISKDALDQVIAAGVESGAEIARQLLASADGVLRANELVARTQAIAEKIGQASAAKFYDAGVENGKAYLKGVMEAIAEAERRIAGAKRPADVKGAGAAFSDTIGRLSTSGGTVQNVTINSQSLDPRLAGELIVDALREYNQRSGYVGLNTTAF
jgi:predicted  nucleic acid-binding Zn-ribbon protein